MATIFYSSWSNYHFSVNQIIGRAFKCSVDFVHVYLLLHSNNSSLHAIVAILPKLVQYCILHKKHIINCKSRRLNWATVVKLCWLLAGNPDIARIITEAPTNPEEVSCIFILH